ncbi:hypothetical protein FACS189414_0690 [Bacteroidia bacterium]|nr:hypothetical protein FACS189414_0690 [Bacteroidia bacterium]
MFNVRAEVKEITIGDALISAYAQLRILGDYLIMADLWFPEQVIHIFYRNSLSYIMSAVNKGQGPGEIANLEAVEVDEIQRSFYVSDLGKYRIFKYKLTSVRPKRLN